VTPAENGADLVTKTASQIGSLPNLLTENHKGNPLVNCTGKFRTGELCDVLRHRFALFIGSIKKDHILDQVHERTVDMHARSNERWPHSAIGYDFI